MELKLGDKVRKLNDPDRTVYEINSFFGENKNLVSLRTVEKFQDGNNNIIIIKTIDHPNHIWRVEELELTGDTIDLIMRKMGYESGI